MKKYLALFVILCLVLSVLFPIFTMAEEIVTPSPESSEAEASPTDSEAPSSPSASEAPSPSEAVSPNPSSSAVPSPSEEVTPFPSSSVAPSPSEEVSPSPSSSVAPSPSEEVSPSPSDSPNPSESPSPSESPAPSPTQKVVDAEALYKTFMEFGNDEDAEQFLMSLSEEELNALEEYALSLKKKNSSPPETVSVTDAGPLVSTVNSEEVERPNAQIMKLMAVRLQCLNHDTQGVELFKDAYKNSDGTYTIKMESYTTGKSTTINTGVPADIVLVLDQSGSMSESFAGSSNKQSALKEAVNGFITSVSNDAVNNKVDHHVAVVTFATSASKLSDFTNDFGGLKSRINSLPNTPNGATNTAEGMSIAKTLIDTASGVNGRNRVVIVFTDGVPTTESDFDTTVASNAISTAKAIKSTGATVYTIGIFGGADPSKLNGDAFQYTLYPDYPCSGEVGSVWGASWFTDFVGDVRFIDIGAGNRFLNYLSSNYADAEKIGIDSGKYNPGEHPAGKGNGYNITQNFTRTADIKYNYYLSADNAAKLSAIFKSISDQIGTPDVTLGNDVEIRDFISDYFNMPVASDISVYTEACTGKASDGNFSWSGNQIPLSSANVVLDPSTKSIAVGGFAYNEQYVTGTARSGTNYGSKLIIYIKVNPRDGFWGGNQVPTNTSSSGLYTGTVLIEDFNVPTVDVLINVPFTAKSVSAYIRNSVEISDLYYPITSPTDPDGWKDDFVDLSKITYTATAFDSKPTADQPKITITATVPPSNPGSEGSKAISADASITVYAPEITYQDSTIYLGEKAKYTDNIGAVAWKHGDTIAVTGNMLGTAPLLHYTFNPEEACFKAATPVDVTVEVGGFDITPFVTFVNKGSHLGSATEKEFTVSVKTCELTVEKSGCDSVTYGDNQAFIIHITGTNLSGFDYADKVDLTVVVNGDSSKTIIGLPVGVYSVTEDGNWSWRYKSSIGSVTLNSSNVSDNISVINSINNPLWLSGSDLIYNIFN